MLVTKIFLLLLIISVTLAFVTIVIATHLSNLFSLPSNTITNPYDEIKNKMIIENTAFPQLIIKKFQPSATPETNIEAIATSNAPYILQVCAKNASDHYDSLSILKGSQLLTQIILMNDTDFICASNSGNAGDKISISTVNVSGVTKLIAILGTTANATASIDYPS